MVAAAAAAAVARRRARPPSPLIRPRAGRCRPGWWAAVGVCVCMAWVLLVYRRRRRRRRGGRPARPANCEGRGATAACLGGVLWCVRWMGSFVVVIGLWVGMIDAPRLHTGRPSQSTENQSTGPNRSTDPPTDRPNHPPRFPVPYSHVDQSHAHIHTPLVERGGDGGRGRSLQRRAAAAYTNTRRRREGGKRRSPRA